MDVDFKEVYIEPYKILGLTDQQRRNGVSSPIQETNVKEKSETSTDAANKLKDLTLDDALSSPT